VNWTAFLTEEVETAYFAVDNLLNKIDPDRLDWKPETGSNWMTVGQLLHHLGDGCGAPFKGFVTGDWGFPPDLNVAEIPPEAMFPPAETLPAVADLPEARRRLCEDKALALKMIQEAGEENLDSKPVAAPWAPAMSKPLGRQLMSMVRHLDYHKAQLFYYLKLQGKKVGTPDLWGQP
jgi:hypothetical protein